MDSMLMFEATELVTVCVNCDDSGLVGCWYMSIMTIMLIEL